MKANACIAGLILFATSVAANTNNVANSWTFTIDNPNNTVSPGGHLLFTIVGTSTIAVKGWRGYETSIDYGKKSNVRWVRTNRYVEWSTGDLLTHARHGRIYIQPHSGTGTATLQMINYSRDVVVSVDFTIVDGTHGHRPPDAPAGKHYKDIVSDGWYEIICVDGDTACKMDIKNGEHDKYHGGPVLDTKHSCGEEGFPGGMSIKPFDTVVFNANDLVIEHVGEHIVATGHRSADNAVCRFSSANPFVLRPVDTAHIADAPLTLTPAPAAPQ